MRALELKLPPPLVALVVALAMWAIARATPVVAAPLMWRSAVALPLLLVGLGFDLAGLLAFRRARTTINPLRPGRTRALVTSGVYRVTRNPMYVGLVFVLTAWLVFLAAPLGVAGPIAFVLCVTRFQVMPEERALLELFGPAYADYRLQVRRWL